MDNPKLTFLPPGGSFYTVSTLFQLHSTFYCLNFSFIALIEVSIAIIYRAGYLEDLGDLTASSLLFNIEGQLFSSL